MMSRNPFKTNEFKRQFAEWNKKLIDDGHREIEDFSLPDPVLKRWDKLKMQNINIEMFQIQERYYELAQESLKTFKFKSGDEKLIWGFHASGYSVRRIEKLLNKKKFKKTKIWEVIRLIRAEIIGTDDGHS